MNAVSHKVSNSLHLVRHVLSNKSAPAKPVETPVNHVAIIDCSGSMYYDLPNIREQLKKRIPKLLGEKDTLSVIWFSGRGQFGTLLEAEPVSTLKDLQEVNKAVDRWLRPVGLTGFKEPLEEAGKLVDRVGKKNGNPFALFFMSDGCDNQWNRQEILKAAEKTAGGLASSTFVEYGYYADRPLLTAMAEKTGGTLIFAQDFDGYSPLFEGAIQKKVSGAPRVEVPVEGDVVGAFAFALSGGDLYSFEVSDGKVSVPEDLNEVWYLSSSAVGNSESDIRSLSKVVSKTGDKDDVVDASYAAISLFSLRAQPKVVYPLLQAVGDVRLIEQFGGCFGKQKYTEFMELSKAAAFGGERFLDGWDPEKVPRDDAFTVLDVLRVLSADDDNRILLDHDLFKYSRISRARLDTDETLTAEEQEKIADLSQRIASEKSVKKLKELNLELAAITGSKQKALKFVADKAKDGYEINNLVFNETRPNVSFGVKKTGTVDLSDRITKEVKKAGVPSKFPTYVFRNYTVIRDGLVNVEVLPVRLTSASVKALSAEMSSGRAPADLMKKVKGTTVLNLKGLPVVNRNMVKDASAKELFLKEWELTKARASQKVYNSVKKDVVPVVSKGFREVYDQDSAAWLQEQGITDYRGFSPPSTVQAESTDFYVAKELTISVKGYSTLPSLKDVRDRIASGKLTASAKLMVPAVEEVEKFLNSETYKNASKQTSLFETWIFDRFKESQSKVRQILFEMSQIRFSVIVGQTWFSEFSSIEEDSMDIEVDGITLNCKVQMKETEIKI